ncbi:MAG: phosphoribosylglycinamide synthetase C domain-containing protein, partial [Bacillota bacterium]|nr:phosphoribosylglycinamide synthetase C domain-containing protein [Bacillota bacterium]
VTENKLADVEIKWKDERAVCVVLASGGYPGSYEKGKLISGLDDVDEDVVVFHAGTKMAPMPEGSKCASCQDDCDMKAGAIVTSGGRVLGVTAMGATHDEARAKAFDNVKRIHFEGMQYRNDIGLINRH